MSEKSFPTFDDIRCAADKIVVEPSGAVPFAMVLAHRERFAGRRVGLILSGGNLDLDHLPWQN